MAPDVPAPLPSQPTRRMPDIQVFGFADSHATRAVERFFRERRVAIHLVDLRKKAIAPGELRRFVDQLGARALLDDTSRAYRDAGLAHLKLDDRDIVERLLRDNRLLRVPLVRHGNEVTAGKAEATWARWLRPAGSGGAGR